VDWVVTYRIEINERNFLIEEFFRGDFDECMRIRQHSLSGGDSDRLTTIRPWHPIVGPAAQWDSLVEGWD
jgi:hypothetical protein